MNKLILSSAALSLTLSLGCGPAPTPTPTPAPTPTPTPAPTPDSFDYNESGFPIVQGDYELTIESSDYICNDKTTLVSDPFFVKVILSQTVEYLKKGAEYSDGTTTSWIDTSMPWSGRIEENAEFTLYLLYPVGDGPLNNGCGFCEIHRTDAKLKGRFTPSGWSGTYEYWRIVHPASDFNDLEVDEICTFSSTFSGKKLPEE
jgi:hypothetical protein